MELDAENYFLTGTGTAGAGSGGGSQGAITFSRYGFAPNSAKSIALCGPDRLEHRVKGVVVQNSGRIRLAVDVDDDGRTEVEVSNGTILEVTCGGPTGGSV